MLKRISALMMAVALAFLMGCQKENHLAQAKPAVHTPEGTEITLKILTENFQNFYDSRIGKIMELVMERFSDKYPNVTLEIEYLPYEAEEASLREMRIDQLRYEILAGEGPDIYLLSNQDRSLSPTFYAWTEPLFTDMNVAMRNGTFHEISAYYNADDALHKEELNQDLMAAGTFGEARYVLPMEFDMPVVHVSEAFAKEYGMTVEELTAGAGSLQAAVLRAMEQSGEWSLDCCLGYDEALGFYPFGQMLDYDEGTVLVTAQEVAESLHQTQQIKALSNLLQGESNRPRYYSSRTFVESYFEFDFGMVSWFNSDIPVYIENAQSAFEYAVIRQVDGGKYTSYPLRANDGTVTATVTTWGAVGSGCDYADVAYDFLREFLTREVQWDLERHEYYSDNGLPFCWNHIPVRTKGLAAPMLDRFQLYYNTIKYKDPYIPYEEILAKRDALVAVEMTDADFPILGVKIDNVLFEHVYDRDYRMISENWFDRDKHAYKELDFDQIAAVFIRDLEFFLAES